MDFVACQELCAESLGCTSWGTGMVGASLKEAEGDSSDVFLCAAAAMEVEVSGGELLESTAKYAATRFQLADMSDESSISGCLPKRICWEC